MRPAGKAVIGPVIEEVMTIRPAADLLRYGTQAFTARNVPFKLVASTASHCSGDMSSILACGKIPALAQSTSMPPFRCATLFAIFSSSASTSFCAALMPRWSASWINSCVPTMASAVCFFSAA